MDRRTPLKLLKSLFKKQGQINSAGFNKILVIYVIFFFLGACAPRTPTHSPGHLDTQDTAIPKIDIPPPVEQSAYIPPPQPLPPTETFSVSVVEVPVKELLFALARDAKMDVDIHADVSGIVTLNVINKTLPQIMERIAHQTGLRYQIEDQRLIISPDLPYLHLYKVDYVNMSRDSHSEVKVSTQISSTGTVDVGGSSGGRK